VQYDPKFQSPNTNEQQLNFLIQSHPPVKKPLIELDVGAALAQIDFLLHLLQTILMMVLD
jgi:hypothetical protein